MEEQQGLIRKKPDLSDLDEALELAAAQLSGGGDYSGYPTNGKVQLREYWRAVRRRLWLILGFALTVTVLVAIYMARKQDVYAAQSRVQVNLENSMPAGGSKGGGQVIFSAPVNDPNYFNTQLQILSGPGLLRRVAKTLDLQHNRDFFRRPEAQTRSTWQNLLRMFNLGGRSQAPAPATTVDDNSLEAKSVAPATSSEDLAEAEKLQPYVDYLQGALRIEPVMNTRLIDIGFSHADPAIAAKVVNTVADVFVLSNLEKQTDTTATQADFMDKRIAELQTEIRNGEERLLNYAKNNQVVSFEGNQNTVVERFVALNQQLFQAENERKTAEAAFQAASAPGAAAAQVARSNQAETAIAQLRQRRALLLTKTTEEWPEVKEIDHQIADLQNQIAESKKEGAATLLTNLRTAYEQALAREQSIRASFNQQKAETLNQNQALINYRILQQEVDTNKGLLDGLLHSSKENEVVRAGTTNNIRVVDYAIKPRGPVGVNRLLGVMVAFPLSLVIGVAMALLLDYLDDTINSESDVEKYFHLPTMGVIPSLESLKQRRSLHAKPSNGLSLAKRDDNGGFRIVITDQPRSPLAEAYRHLRTSLLLSSVGGPPKVILVTSTLPSEGKTTTAMNLAVTLAQGGAEVLLIDGDLRRPCLHTAFNLDNERGLSTIISSDASADSVKEMIAHDGESRLSVLTSGPTPPNPADHLGSEKMRLLLRTFASTYTHVVIDSPPLSSFTDGILLATMAQSVVFVVQGGRASHEAIRRANRMLNDVGVSITGVVLNNVQISRDDRYYYYQQYYKSANGTNGTNGANGSKPQWL